MIISDLGHLKTISSEPTVVGGFALLREPTYDWSDFYDNASHVTIVEQIKPVEDGTVETTALSGYKDGNVFAAASSEFIITDSKLYPSPKAVDYRGWF